MAKTSTSSSSTISEKATSSAVNMKTLAEQLVQLTVQQANELANILEKEHGIRPTMTATPQVAVVTKKEEEKKTVVNLLLGKVGGSKTKILMKVKVLRKGTTLLQAKKIIEEASEKTPQILREKMQIAEAEKVKSEFEALGATIILQ